MFWLADEEFSVTVPLVWERAAQDGRDVADEFTVDTVRMEGIAWRQKGQAHYLQLKDPDDPSGNANTVLRLLPDKVVWTRFGDVTWNHTFVAGQTGSSILRMSGLALDVRTVTHELEVFVGPGGGRLALTYHMETGGAEQEVRLRLRFGADAEE